MTFKKALAASSGTPLLGAFIGMASPPLAEMAARAGFDFIIFDGEHGVFSRLEMEECLRSARFRGTPAIVRTADADPTGIQAALDSGATGIQVPSVVTAAEADAIVIASQFPPRGRRGFGSTTSTAGYGFRQRSDVMSEAQAETVVAIQVESRRGVDQLTHILTVEGVDAVFLGTSDLSLDYGFPTPADQRMVGLLQKLIPMIVASGKACGVHVTDLEQINPLRSLGVRYFTVSVMALIVQSLQAAVKDFRSHVEY
ncbi:MAG: hypothetical protein DWQ09_09395 [Proteobacteria bacterium]|nr:MAG: hypothetical protein DWQ09_09395 [Pseudomonadota bacterium]QKK10648.1 MAG: hypothetical protein HND59_02570 [Pseudomonadota bacterium]